ncbi:hypothetical protein SCBWM1_gp22 [Synechococcus phage S-CBWM1]|uniref:Uncharacterized protein n=1 Tax=Synechococcus phage S-CBWM1 TaxID=2053653 RepID=A0A3G1L3E5_9CAUD|nr:hypothetical protein HOU61_gp175 [Synechococcus phage S-CBWM1]ATW62706.1 hypothetical protein SCBWM1_gp22 [Synechococcus phage S-CBWM1]
MTKNVGASLRLFNCVISEGQSLPSESDYAFSGKCGILIHPSAYHERERILEFYEENSLTGDQINKTFFSSAEKVRNTPFLERLLHQLLHYFSTYGLRSLGLDSPDFIYLPDANEDKGIPEPVVVRTIRGVSREELVSRCLSMLQSGVALKQETIEDVLAVLSDCDHQFTEIGEVRNREVKNFLYDILGTFPEDGDELFRYLMFKATGDSLVINNENFLDKLRETRYILPNLSGKQIRALSESFNRRKTFWMALKQGFIGSWEHKSREIAAKGNRRLINKISKASKTNHKALPENVLSSLTAKKFPAERVEEAAAKANTFQLARAANAVSLYSQSVEQGKFFKVRNGRGFLRSPGLEVDRSHVGGYLPILRGELLKRLSEKRVFIPEGVEYPVPSSEKKFSGNVPTGTSITADPKAGEKILVGIYWENGTKSHADLDLSSMALSGSRVGWNARWENGGCLTYSGDITNAPNGAAEWMEVKNVKEASAILVNAYSIYPNEGGPHPFKIMVGKTRAQDTRNYFLKPDEILLCADSSLVQKQMILGVLDSTAEGKIRFTLIDRGNGKTAIGSDSTTMIKVALEEVSTALPLSQLVTRVAQEEADYDLTMETLSRDTFLSLLS